MVAYYSYMYGYLYLVTYMVTYYGYILWIHIMVTYMVPYGSIWSHGLHGLLASAIGVLTNLSGMEVFVQRDVDGNSARDQERLTVSVLQLSTAVLVLR